MSDSRLYHVTPDGAKSCSASVRNCPFGGVESHFSSLAEATSASEERLADEFKRNPLRKQKPTIPADTVRAMVDELYEASDNYYQKGVESALSDDEFDAKLEYLQELADSGVYGDIFAEGSKGFNLLETDPALGTTAKGETVEHVLPMLSLAKAKEERELISFLEKARAAGAKDFRLQAKMDGLAVAAEYSGGKLFRLSTRGDGQHGEDTTYLIKDPKVKIKGLELTISELESLEIRGELFFTNAQFKAVDESRFQQTGQRFKNARNSATGLMKAAKGGVDYPVEFTFAAYSVIKNGKPDELTELGDQGFVSIDEFTDVATPSLALSGFKTNAEVMDAVHAFGELREGFDFPTDGVVIKPTNESELLASMGYTSHHPVSQVAWKYPAATATTEVLSISITVGRSGKVTPVAKVRAVDLDGSTVQNASLHNYNLVATKGIRVGSIVLIEKANEIIPQIKVVISNPSGTEEVQMPSQCPACGTLLSYNKEEKIWPPRTLRCPNDDCDSRKFFALKTAVSKSYMDIDGMSESSLEHLNSIGRVMDMADLYSLTVEELADSQLGESQNGTPRRLGEKRATHIVSYIEKSKTRPLTKMLPALAIDLLGRSASRDLEKKFGDLDGILGASKEQIAALDGFGPIKAEKIYEGLQRRRPLIEKLRKAGVTFGAGAPKPAPAADAIDLTGKSFAISGAVPPGFANRGQWVDYVEANGGTFHSGPKADTTFVIGDPSETSAKVQKATKLGLTFISPADFTSRYVKK